MNLEFWFILCIGIISCLSVTAADNDADDGGLSGRGRKIDIHECTGQYLKSKGKLASDVPIGNSSPAMCRVLLQNYGPAGREEFENRAKEDFPNETACLMTEFDQSGIVDFILKAAFYQTYEGLTAAEKAIHYNSIANEADKLRDTFAATCGIKVDTFEKFLSSVFKTGFKTAVRPETESVSETVTVSYK